MDRALVEEFINQRVWAVVGASSNPEKVGYHVVSVLRRSGYTVYPVNPRYTEIEGLRCYPTVAELPEQPGVVNLVVRPEVGLEIVRQCAAAGIERVWFQPGAESPANTELARQLGLKVVAGDCAMVLRKRRWT
jgi:predicted CoA-binding protein